MAVINGTNQGDIIEGTDGNDVIQAGQNKDNPDVVNAGAGDDVVYGKSFDPDNASNPSPDAGNPTEKEIVDSTQNGSIEDGAPEFYGNEIYGDEGNDLVIGERNADTLYGDNDTVGEITYNGFNGKVSYDDVPQSFKDEGLDVTGSAPESAADNIRNDNGEGAGVGDKAVDYLYRQDRKAFEDTNADGKDYEGGEIFMIELPDGASAKSVTIKTDNLDTGESAKVTGYLDGKVVGTTKLLPSDDDSQDVSFGAGVVFDKVSIEANANDSADTLNKSTSFNIEEVSFETVASGDDTLVGGKGSDTMYGGYGNDLFIEDQGGNDGNTGSDHIDGGFGFDTVDYSGEQTGGSGLFPGIVVNLSDGEITASVTGGNNNTLSVEVNEETTTKENDSDRAGNRDYVVEENSSLTTRGEAQDKLVSIEKVIGTGRQDVMMGSEEKDVFVGNGGGDLLLGEGGDDKLNGGDGNDLLSGGADNDKLIGGEGDDEMLGGTGNDKGIGGLGNDTFDGGEGVDTFKVGGHVADGGGAEIRLNNGTALVDRDGVGGAEETDILISVENVDGTKGDDTIAGNSADNVLKGGRGDDFLNGLQGDDTVVGGLGNDTVRGEAGNDTYKVGGRVDTSSGDGDGVGGVVLDMSQVDNDGFATAEIDRDGDGEADEFDKVEVKSNGLGIENITTTKGNDVVTGSAADNVIKTGKGDDVINAGDGNDTVKAGKGDDVLDGGEGADKLFAGKGNDLLVFDQADFADASTKTARYKTDGEAVDEQFDLNNKGNKVETTKINEKIYQGGQGYDVLKVDTDAEINMLGKGIGGIEAIVANGDGDQTVSADLNEIRRESDDAGAARDKGFDTFTFIGGEGDDQLNLFGNGWTLRGSSEGNFNAGALTNQADILGQDELAAINAGLDGGNLSLNGANLPVLNNGSESTQLNAFVFEKGNGTFVTVWTDLTADDIYLNGVSLDPAASMA
ncbi:MAG: calcium-binding protein [Pseudomonadota bacterium]